MAVLRKEKKNNFTVIDNAIFKDRTLSLKATGLLCKMLSLPDNWEYSVQGLSKLTTDGISSITSGLKELTEAGYFRREQRYKDGKFAGYEYIISETKKCEFPFSENPLTENTITENHAQLNTNSLSTNSLSTKELHTEFENLWSIYPRKQGKDKAYGFYEKARKKGTTYEEVYRGIEAYVASIEANETEMQYVKMGSTFFSQKAWQDDWSVRTKRSENPFTEMLMEGDY